MIDQIFLQQLKRSKKTIFYLLLLVIVIAFFVTSVNLYRNSTENLQKAEETYSTLAVTELYGDVDRYGNLVEKNSETHIGYKAVGVEGYNIGQLIDSSAVDSWDLRKNYGAFIDSQPAMYHGVATSGKEKFDLWETRSPTVIRFKIKEPQPIHMMYPETDWLHAPYYDINLEILDEASGFFCFIEKFKYQYMGISPDDWIASSDELKKINQTEDTDRIILYPDVEYVAVINASRMVWTDHGTLELTKDASLQWHDFKLMSPYSSYDNICVTYAEHQESVEFRNCYQRGLPFPLQRWEDVQNNPELKKYFDDVVTNVKIQQCIYNIQTTNDVTSIPAYHVGGAALSAGRLITEEEYRNGKNVCMISSQMAQNQRWELGDKIHMKLFEDRYIPDGSAYVDQPIYNRNTTTYVHEAEYEIVGIYDLNPTTGNSGISADTLTLRDMNIYIPERSIPVERSLDDTMVHGSLFSMKLKNGSIDQFLSDMEAKGITTEKEGQYNPKFTFYDQGYSMVQPGLQAMNTTAKLLLALSIILLLITCVLLAYFFWQNQKQTVGIFRLLGGTKKNAVAAVLLCALILCGIGAGIGGAIGYGMAEVVGNEIMENNFKENENDALLQAYVLDASDKENIVEVKADPLLTVGACGAVLLFPAVMLLFLGQDINKEPRELLPKAKL